MVGFFAEVLPTIAFALFDLSWGGKRPEEHRSGIGRRQNGLRLDPPLEFLVQPLDRIRGAYAAPLARRQTSKREEPIAGLLQAVGNSTMLEPPFADEGLATGLDLLTRGRVDHVVVIRGDLLVQALGRMRQQVPVLVNRAALDRYAVPNGGNGLVEPRRAVDNEELGPPQPALDEVIEDSAPGLGALAAHALDREQYLLAIRAHAENDEQRDGGCFAVEQDAPHRAVETEQHDRILGQREGVARVSVAIHVVA